MTKKASLWQRVVTGWFALAFGLWSAIAWNMLVQDPMTIQVLLLFGFFVLSASLCACGLAYLAITGKDYL